MRTRRHSPWLALLIAFWLGGCATVQQPIELATDHFATPTARNARVGVAMVELPKPDTSFPGAYCLLCMAVANGMHTALNKEVQALGTADLGALPQQLADLLKARGVDAVVIDSPLAYRDLPDLRQGDAKNKSTKDFSALKARYGIDRLLLVHVTALGVSRPFASYVPTGAPQAVMFGAASLVDLKTHDLEWHLPLALSRQVDGPWDEPPRFPGLTTAYHQVVATGVEAIKKPFAR